MLENSDPPTPGLAHDPTALLEVRNLHVSIQVPDGLLQVVDGVSFSVARGESLGLIGESGSGKSVTALSILRLLNSQHASIDADTMRFDKTDLTAASSGEIQKLRGGRVGFVFQEPMSSLNPVLRVGNQVTESLRIHRGMKRAESRAAAPQLLHSVQISDPEARARQYPHNLSGGMRQRVMIASALACNPELLILDEPTTALDVTVQAQILELLRQKRAESGLAMLLISHNIGVISTMTDRIAVMYGGRIVESGPTADILRSPSHPYTQALVAAMPESHGIGERLTSIPGVPPVPRVTRLPGCSFAPRCTDVADTCRTVEPVIGIDGPVACWYPREPEDHLRKPTNDEGRTVHAQMQVRSRAFPVSADREIPAAMVSVRNLSKVFAARGFDSRKPGNSIHALQDVSFDVMAGEIFGIVGESGCGKSTLARIICGIEQASAGEVQIHGVDVSRLTKRDQEGRQLRRDVQYVFQDPYASLNPRMTVTDALEEVLRANATTQNEWKRREVRKRLVAEVLESVGLGARAAARYPHEFSGGQRQRIAIARALVLKPKVILCDEPVSALDLSIQGQILNLFHDLRSEFGLTFIVISHDLSVVRHVTDRTMVMYLGRTMELGTSSSIAIGAQHPYTEALLSAAPTTHPYRRDLVVLEGDIPSPTNPPAGCVFHTRCWVRSDTPDPTRCATAIPPKVGDATTSEAWCHFPLGMPRQASVIMSEEK
ncbi:MAG: ABC transporter ATP-binding protein [Actinomycetota bacterium]|nr:ABC transporter ATP-binding protein [Actinomycetota bacterium]MDQ2957321.1 ABC transporter ATP-binding protein [Actinomycetota bacterium]